MTKNLTETVELIKKRKCVQSETTRVPLYDSENYLLLKNINKDFIR